MRNENMIEQENPQCVQAVVMPSLTHGSLFSGIGGFDLAAEWMGWENEFHCEWNDFGKKILKYYWPNSISYDDITKTDFTIWRGRIDVLTGGFPCQPYSQAGKRLGKEDERHLWPEMLRAIREIAPRYIVGENVLGITNWSGGLVFEEVQVDLEAEGYEVQPVILPACGINAPHRRDRVWFVAYAKNIRHIYGAYERKSEGSSSRFSEGKSERSSETITDTECIRQQKQRESTRPLREETLGKRKASWTYDDDRWPTQSPVCNGNDGISERLDTTSISKRKWNEESIKGGGNAIVPQVAFQIFKAIALHDVSLSEA